MPAGQVDEGGPLETPGTPWQRWAARIRGEWPLLPVLAIGTALRLDNLRQPLVDAFSWRQASTAMIAGNFYRTNSNILYPQVDWTGPGPNYRGREFQTLTWITSRLYHVFGQLDWLGRAVAITFGLWSIIALYGLVRRVWDRDHAVAAAGLLAVIPGAVFIDRSLLPDPAMAALVVTSCWLLVAYLQDGRRHQLVLATVTGAVGIMTKLPGLIVGLPMVYATFAVVGVRRLRERRTLLPLALSAAGMLVPVVAYYMWARHLALSYPPHHFAGSSNWLWVGGFESWWQDSWFLSRAWHHAVVWMWGRPVVVLVALSLLLRPPRPRQGGSARWFFHWWLAGCGLFYLIGAKELVANPWNFQIFMPAFAALGGHAIVSAGQLIRRVAGAPAAIAIPVALAVVVVTSRQGLGYMYHEYAAESREMGLALRRASSPGDLVITMANALGDPVGIYYSGRRGWVFPPALEDQGYGVLPDDDRESVAMYERLRNTGARWLGVVAEQRPSLLEDHPVLANHLWQSCEWSQDTRAWFICRIRPPETPPQGSP